MKYQRQRQQGFQDIFKNDLCNIEQRIQEEVDPDISIMWNPHTGEHLIMDDMIEIPIMRIPQVGFPILASNVIYHLHSIRVGEGFSAIKKLDDNESVRKQASEKNGAELAHNFAQDTLNMSKTKTYVKK